MAYVPLPNFNYDSGPRRIQSGPDHEGYVVLYSGVQSTGPDEGIIVAGAPLSGTITQGAWDYDANWRYVPSTLPSQSGVLNPTSYNVSGALDTYDATRIYTRNTVAGAQIASAIGPETGAVYPRGAPLQPRADVTQPEKYMYFGGAAPDNQNYSPYNTPDANSAAEGKTGGGVTHKTFESSLLTNVLGGQGTSDRSQWRYHQPVYCKTYTETKRSEVPGLMSTPLRAMYRGGSTSYNYNYGAELLANRGGFELLPSDYPRSGGSNSADGVSLSFADPAGQPYAVVGGTATAGPICDGGIVTWFRLDPSAPGGSVYLAQGYTYTISINDVGYRLFAKVACPDPTSTTGFTEPSPTSPSPIVTTVPGLPFATGSGTYSPTSVTTVTIYYLWEGSGPPPPQPPGVATCQPVLNGGATTTFTVPLGVKGWRITIVGTSTVISYPPLSVGGICGGYVGLQIQYLRGDNVWVFAGSVGGGSIGWKKFIGTITMSSTAPNAQSVAGAGFFY